MPDEEDEDGQLTLEQLEEEKRRKAAQWYEEQMKAGAVCMLTYADVC